MNQLNIIGFLGKDPESRFTQQGQKITTFSIASGKDESLFWVRCTAFGDTHDKMISYLKKGSLIGVQGDFKKPRTYVDKSGVTQVSIEIIITNLYFLPSKSVEKTTSEISVNNELPF
jgi:single-strand DNA-binding protein